MPLQPPVLDDRTFDQLLSEARLRIPRYTPEWTDFNDSDPGMTLVQLFAWLTEMMLYRMNQVPDLNYVKFLQLLDMELRPARPATAHVTFFAQAKPASPGPIAVPLHTEVSAQAADGSSLTFETTEGIDLINSPLVSVQVFDGSAFSDVTDANATLGVPFFPLGWTPQVGSALYLGFDPGSVASNGPPSPAGTSPFPQEMSFRVFMPLDAQTGKPLSCREAVQPPAPQVSLVWEYKPDDNQRWRRLSLYQDESVAFTREGYIKVQGPTQIVPVAIPGGKVPGARYWLRCRLDRGKYNAGKAPVFDFIRPNVVQAENLSTVRDEFLMSVPDGGAEVSESSNGNPDQVFITRYRPVQPDSLILEVENERGEMEQWIRKSDFLASGPQDPHYQLIATTGRVRFGDGKRGRIPVAGAEIVAREYRYGGGLAGNVGSDVVSGLTTKIAGVDRVTNERPAVGGEDEQKIENLKEQAPSLLRSRRRAVSAEDFRALALEVGGVARATAVPLAHPDYPGVEVPGAITVVIVPDSSDVPPVPSPDLIREVCRHLETYRLITTELYVKGPEYYPLSVKARVLADPYAAAGTVERNVVNALNDFLNPLRGLQGVAQPAGNRQPQAFEFGLDFPPTRLYGVIQAVENVLAVPNLELTVKGAPYDKLGVALPLPPDALVYGVNHAITVEPFRDL